MAGPFRRSSSRSASTTTEPVARLDAAIFEAIRGTTRRPVDLETVLDRVDWTERTVPTFEELSGGLRRRDTGLIREVGPGRYFDARRSSLGGPVSELTSGAYEGAVRRRDEGFARDVVWLNSSFLARAPVRFLEAAHRLTGGRVGLEPGMVDLDGTSLLFLLDLELEPIGWTCHPSPA